jgi:hypothetical protein
MGRREACRQTGWPRPNDHNVPVRNIAKINIFVECCFFEISHFDFCRW